MEPFKIVTFVYVVAIAAYSLCQGTWVVRGSFQYQVSSTKIDCVLAEAQCQRELGYLAVVTSSADNDFLSNLSTSAYFGYWKKQDDIPTKWTWLDGGNYQYSNWFGGIPPTGLAQTECYCSFITSAKTWRYDNCVRVTPTSNNFICQRPQNFCTTTACKNGGTCVQSGTNFKCSCVDGTSGRLCENVTQYCLSNPCHRGVCFNKLGSYECACEAGYTGNTCETDINECLSKPCQNHGNCSDLENSYECLCPHPYNGTHCENFTDVNSGATHGQKPSRASLTAIIFPVLIVSIVMMAAALVLYIVLRERCCDGGKAYKSNIIKNRPGEWPETCIREPSLQPLNRANKNIHSILRGVSKVKLLNLDPQQLPVNGQYDRPQFHASELPQAVSPLLGADSPKKTIHPLGPPGPERILTPSSISPQTSVSSTRSWDQPTVFAHQGQLDTGKPLSVAVNMNKTPNIREDALNGQPQTNGTKVQQGYVPLVYRKPILKKSVPDSPSLAGNGKKTLSFEQTVLPGYMNGGYVSASFAPGGIRSTEL